MKKRLLACCLILTMCFSMSTAAFADEVSETSIVSESETGQNVDEETDIDSNSESSSETITDETADQTEINEENTDISVDDESEIGSEETIIESTAGNVNETIESSEVSESSEIDEIETVEDSDTEEQETDDEEQESDVEDVSVLSSNNDFSSLILNDTSTFNYDLALKSLDIAQSTYGSGEGAINLLQNYGFSNIVTEHMDDWNINKPGRIFAYKRVYLTSDYTVRTIVVVSVKGTEWSDLDTVATDINGVSGFSTVGKNILTDFKKYCKNNSINLNDSRTTVYLTGHSLGAATCGELAVKLAQESNFKAKIVGYLYASPFYNMDGLSNGNIFQNIHTFIHTKDVVPKMAFGGRVGEEIVIISKAKAYSHKNDSVVGNHSCETYKSLLEGMWANTCRCDSSMVSISADSLSLSNTSTGVKLNWSKSANATGYLLYYKTKGMSDFEFLDEITSGSTTSYVHTGAKTSGQEYQYIVVAERKYADTTYVSDPSNTKKIYYVSTPKISSLVGANGSITVNWSKAAAGSGYQIQYSLYSDFSHNKVTTVSNIKTVSQVIKSLTYQKRYYFRIRVYLTKGVTKYYSPWSAACSTLAATKYSITYKLNGGKNNSSNPSGYYKQSATITLKNPTRSGYTFQGWYSDSKYTKRVTKIVKGSVGNKVFYAKWKRNYDTSMTTLTAEKSYSIDLNGGAAETIRYTFTKYGVGTSRAKGYFSLYVNNKLIYICSCSVYAESTVTVLNIDSNDKYKEIYFKTASCGSLDLGIIRYYSDTNVQIYRFDASVSYVTTLIGNSGNNEMYFRMADPYYSESFGLYWAKTRVKLVNGKLVICSGSHSILYNYKNKLISSMRLYNTPKKVSSGYSVLKSGTSFYALYVMGSGNNVSKTYKYSQDIWIKVKTTTGKTGWLYFENSYNKNYLEEVRAAG